MERYIRAREICEKLGLSHSTLWRMRRRGEFPEPVKLSRGVVAWPESMVEEWIESQWK